MEQRTQTNANTFSQRLYRASQHRDAHWVEAHLLVPQEVLLAEAHRMATEIEQAVEKSLEPHALLTTHLECASDHAALHPHEVA